MKKLILVLAIGFMVYQGCNDNPELDETTPIDTTGNPIDTTGGGIDTTGN